MKDPALLARAILADPRFRPHGTAPHPSPSLLERAVDWLRTTWQHLIDSIARQVHVSTGTTNVAGDVLLALLVALILATIVRLLLSISREAPLAPATILETAQHGTAAEFYAQALALAGTGAYRQAAALLYRAALALLNERGIVRESPSATAGEVERALRRSDRNAASVFAPIARRFTDAAYAETALDAEAWNDALVSYRRLEARPDERP